MGPLPSASLLHEFPGENDEDESKQHSNSFHCYYVHHRLEKDSISGQDSFVKLPQTGKDESWDEPHATRYIKEVTSVEMGKCLFPTEGASLRSCECSAEADNGICRNNVKVISPRGHNQKNSEHQVDSVKEPFFCTKCMTAMISGKCSQSRQTLSPSFQLIQKQDFLESLGLLQLFLHKLTCESLTNDSGLMGLLECECRSHRCKCCDISEVNSNCYKNIKYRNSVNNMEIMKDNNFKKSEVCIAKRKVEGRRRHRFIWMMFFSTFFFLSLFGPAASLSILDDEDDDEFGGTSAFSHGVYPRFRRSAESFSTLHDALSLIPTNYSIHEPPPTNNSEATQVDFSVLIMNVRDIKELNEGYGDLELSLEMNLRIYWKDTRLSHLADRSGNKFIVLNPVLLDKIWHPDIFIDHVKGVAQPALISKPASLRVYPDSSVRYSARITVTMACQMDFHYYPADTQRCNVDMKSYAYSSKILALDWREGKGALLVEYLELPNFDVALDTTQNFMVNTSSGSYAGIRFTILLRRKLSYHLIQTYLPSTLFIIVSWLSFLVPPESVPGRMALCMTTLLTLTAMFSAVRQNTPNVSYVKALDIWMVVCIIFVFLTLVEYTVLLKLKSKKPKPKPLPPQTELETSPPAPPPPSTQPQQPINRWTIPTFQYSSDANNFKFRGCKNTDGVLNENGSTGEIRHRENGDSISANGDGNANNTLPTTPQLPPPPPPPPPTAAVPLAPGERQLNKYEMAAKKIERFTSAVIPTLFVIFNFIYWPWLIESADYYHHEKSTTIFKSM